MFFRNRLMGGILVLVAGIGLLYGCQTRDGSIPTEADRSIQATGEVEDAIIDLIDELFDPALGKSVKKSFSSIVADLTKNKVAVARSKTLTLIDFILKHYQDGNLIPQDGLGGKVGILNLEMLQYVGLIPNVEDAAAAACLPGDPVCEAFPEDGLAEIPGDLITEPFNLIVVEVDCSTLDPGINWVPPCYEVTTVPEQNFETSTSSSLSLSQFDSPVVGVCAEFAAGLTPGIDVFLYHAHDGVIEQTPFAPNVTVCDELASQWANPILARFQPVIEMLGPQPLYATAALAGSVSGVINNFSTLFACEPGCLPTTTMIEILNGSGVADNSFEDGETITLRATVTQSPTDTQAEVFFLIRLNSASGTPTAMNDVTLTDGVAEWDVVCGVDVPHSALAAFTGFYGTVAHELSESSYSFFTCND